MLAIGLISYTMALGPMQAKSQTSASKPISNSSADLHFINDIMATRPNDKRLYVLLGSGFLRPTTYGDVNAFVKRWLGRHKSSIFIPISRILTTNTISHQQFEIVYVWIEEGASSLNVDLIRSGIFIAATMYDMVDNRNGLDALLKRDPKLADARLQVEKERTAAPQDTTDRLISNDDYKVRLSKIEAAEQFARAQKIGIWSNAMKDEREADGIR